MDNQIYLFNPEDYSIYKQVDDIVEKSVVSGDPIKAWDFANALMRGVVLRGTALAKLLWGIKNNWHLFEAGGTDEGFFEASYAALGLSLQTVKKYVNMWERIFENPDVPDDIKQQLLGRNIKTLLLLSSAAIEADLNWQEVVETTNDVEVRDIVHAAVGGRTSSANRLNLFVDLNGNILATNGDGGRHAVGNIRITSDDLIVQRAVERIIKSAGLIEVMT